MENMEAELHLSLMEKRRNLRQHSQGTQPDVLVCFCSYNWNTQEKLLRREKVYFSLQFRAYISGSSGPMVCAPWKLIFTGAEERLRGKPAIREQAGQTWTQVNLLETTSLPDYMT